jgi:hypothetical protein
MNHCSLSETILSEKRTHVTYPLTLPMSQKTHLCYKAALHRMNQCVVAMFGESGKE